MIKEIKKNRFFRHYKWSSPRFDFGSFAFYHICVSNKLQFINTRQMTQTYFVQTQTLRIYFKKPKMNSKKFPNGFAQKTKYTIFHKPQTKNRLPPKLPIHSIDNYKTERSSSIKFVEVMVDEHLNWKDFINILGNRLSNKISQYESNYILYYSFITI